MAWLLTDALRGCYWLRRHTAEWLAVAQVGLQAAEERRDAGACAAMHLSLGTAHWGTGDYRVAAGHFEHAVEFSRQAGDRFREFSTLGNLGDVYAELGSLEEAIGCFRRELAFYAEIGDTARRARALGNLGQTEMRLGRLVEAAADLRAAVELREEIGQTRLAANSLGALGVVHRYLGDLDQAAHFLERARQLNHDHEDRVSEAAALDDLARVHRDAGRADEALRCAEQALSLAKGSGRVEIDALITVASVRGRREDLRLAWRRALDIGYGHGVADALVELAWLDLAAGDVEAAVRDATQGCERAVETGQNVLAGLALVALSRAQEEQGDLDGAADAGRRAASMLADAGYQGVRDRPNGL
ncbi:tetratricopeptide repeat protein [Lentzea sp. NPDC034063]|uniref:tetratricopeptide repeat protein n=1 Tax=unclassified Lentzea TaxID=2643253 RepID=UPI0033CC62DF